MNAMNEKISAIGVVPVIKLNHPERDAAGLAKALCDGDVPVAEVTFRAAGADKAIRIMKECCPDMLVGAGTVTNTAQIDGRRLHRQPRLRSRAGHLRPGEGDPDLSRLHHRKRVSPGAEIRPGSDQVLPGRAERGPGEDQSPVRTLPDVQGHAHGRHLAEKSERIPSKKNYWCDAYDKS